MMGLVVVNSGTVNSKRQSLESFLESLARQHRDGMKLDQFVREALRHDYQGRQHGELTNRVNRTLKKLVRDGILQKDEDFTFTIV